MYEKILIEMKKYYSDIAKHMKDDKVFVITKDNKNLCISKSLGELRFVTYCNDIKYSGVDNVFEYKEVLLAIGALNEYIEDIDKRKDFFEMVVKILKEAE